jgi:hypothetical protein
MDQIARFGWPSPATWQWKEEAALIFTLHWLAVPSPPLQSSFSAGCDGVLQLKTPPATLAADESIVERVQRNVLAPD